MRIRVRVFKRAGRECFEAQWTDPVTGKKKTKTTGAVTRKDALKFAGKLQAELEEGRFKEPTRATWAEFRERYETEVLAGHAVGTRLKAVATLNAVERLISPNRLEALNASQVSVFQARLRNETEILIKIDANGKRRVRRMDRADATIKSHLSVLRAALHWAEKIGMLDTAPVIQMPRRVVGMKGRPITKEEFERMRGKVAEVVGSDIKDTWMHLLDGLWWSGLRLGEAMILHWTDDRNLCVDLTGRRPMFRIRAHAEKGRRDRLLPMAPEFAEFLNRIPTELRKGFVFDPRPQSDGPRLSSLWVSRIVTRIGEKATVKVAESRNGRVKYASAHDLRRAFGFRWSSRVMPPVLMQLMRHESVQTTMQFYVGRNAEAVADQLWRAIADETANIDPVATVATFGQQSETPSGN